MVDGPKSRDSFDEGREPTLKYVAALEELARRDIPAMFLEGELDEVLDRRLRVLIQQGLEQGTFDKLIEGRESSIARREASDQRRRRREEWFRQNRLWIRLVGAAVVIVGVGLVLRQFGFLGGDPSGDLSSPVPVQTAAPAATATRSPGGPSGGDPDSPAEIVAFVDQHFAPGDEWLAPAVEFVRSTEHSDAFGRLLADWELTGNTGADFVRRGMAQAIMAAAGIQVGSIDGDYQLGCEGGSCMLIWEDWGARLAEGGSVLPQRPDGEDFSDREFRFLAPYEKYLIYEWVVSR